LDLNFDRVDRIDERDFLKTALKKCEVEIVQVSTPENHKVFVAGQCANRVCDKFFAGVQMTIPSRSAAFRAMANGDLGREQTIRSREPGTRRHHPL
jgi:hypothetical protein